ncbi:MAG: cyclase family protein [Egibacteraceae bacterium]
MELIDVTVKIRPGMVTYEGDPDVRISSHAAIAAGDLCNVSRLGMGSHTGTHVDAPLHFIPGAGGVEMLPLDAMLGPAWVIDATGHTRDLDRVDIPEGAERVLLKTDNSRLWDLDRFSPDFIGLTPRAAELLVARGVRLVGIDYLSIAPAADPAPTHLVLLGAGVVILEGLDLRGVEPGAYELRCLPLLIPGADGAPARVILAR